MVKEVLTRSLLLASDSESNLNLRFTGSARLSRLRLARARVRDDSEVSVPAVSAKQGSFPNFNFLSSTIVEGRPDKEIRNDIWAWARLYCT